MNFDFQLKKSTLENVLKNVIEKKVLARNLNLGGVRPLPFCNSLLDLFNGNVTIEHGIVEHIKVNNFLLAPSPVASTMLINLPPVFVGLFSRPPILPSEPFLLTVTNSLKGIARVTFFLAKKTDMQSAGMHEIDRVKFTEITLKITYKIKQPEVTSEISLKPELEKIEIEFFGLLLNEEIIDSIPDLEIQAAIRAFILYLNSEENRHHYEMQPIVLPIAGITDILERINSGDTSHRIWNAGIRNSNDGIIFNLRLQIDRSDLIISTSTNTFITEWSNYFSNSLPNKIKDKEWGFFFPSDFFKETIENKIREGLSTRADISLDDGGIFTTAWNISSSDSLETGPCLKNGTVNLNISFPASLIDACPIFNNDIGLDIIINTSITLRGNILRVDLHLDYDLVDSDVFLCAVELGLLTAAVGFVSGGTLGVWIGAAIGSAIGLLLGSIGTIVYASTYTPDIPTSNNFERVPGTEMDFFLEVPLPRSRAGELGTLVPETLIACNDGLTIAGSLFYSHRQQGRLGDPSSITDFRWESTGNCERPHFVGGTYLQWSRLDGSIPLFEWVFNVLETNQDRVEIIQEQIRHEWLGQTLLFVYFSEEHATTLYYSSPSEPYFELLIQTNIGSRIVRINGIGEALSPEALNSAKNLFERRCLLRDIEDEMERGLPLPVPEKIKFNKRPEILIEKNKSQNERTRWIFAATKVNAKQSLQLSYKDQSENTIEIKSLIPDKKGSILIEFWDIAEDTVSESLLLKLNKEAPLKKEINDNFKLKIIRTLTNHHSTIYTNNQIQRVKYVMRNNNLGIVILTKKNLLLYEIQSLAAPQLVYDMSLRKISELITLRGKHLLFGEGGLFLLDYQNLMLQKITANSVTNIIEDSSGYIVIGEKSLGLYSPDFNKTQEIYQGKITFIEHHDKKLICKIDNEYLMFEFKDFFNPEIHYKYAYHVQLKELINYPQTIDVKGENIIHKNYKDISIIFKYGDTKIDLLKIVDIAYS